MNPSFEKVIAYLKQKNTDLEEYQEYLKAIDLKLDTLTQHLTQRKIPLQDYYQFLTTNTSTKTFKKILSLSKETQRKLHALGNELIQSRKITLQELNQIFQTLPKEHFFPERVLAVLLKQRKIHLEEFTDFLKNSQSDTILPSENYQLQETEGTLSFCLAITGEKEQLGGYELLEELGRGGMGVVYKAYHPKLQTHVAIKMMIAGESASEKAIQRFQREMKVLGKLEHPGIVKILDVGTEGKKSYFVMEYVPGESLEKARSRLSIREKVEIILKVLEALYYAHQEKIIHRDIKLENILITSNQVPKILDFGLAKELESEETLKLTQSGTFFGTGHYMAPEQARGDLKNIGPRTDLYAVGICLYRLLTGYYPYEGSTLQDLLSQIEKGSAKLPRVWNPNIHKDLEAIVMKSISSDPQMRYVSARFFARDLKNFLAGHPVEASLFKTEISRWKTWSRKHQSLLRWTTFFLAILMLMILGLFWNQNREKRKYLEAQFALAQEKYDQSRTQTLHEKTKDLWEALIFINKFLILESSKKAEELKWEIGRHLLDIAYLKQSYLWANYLIEELEHLEKIPSKKRDLLREEQDANRKRKLVYYQKRLQYWEKKLKSGEATPSEKADVIYEIIKMEEETIVQKVKQIVETGNQYMLALKSHRETPEIAYYKRFVEIAGRYQKDMFIPVLKSGLLQLGEQVSKKEETNHNLQQTEYMILLVKALSQYPIEKEIETLYKLRIQMKRASLFYQRTETIFNKWLSQSNLEFMDNEIETENSSPLKKVILLMDAGKLEEALTEVSEEIKNNPQNAMALNLRGSLQQKKGEISQAIEDFTLAITLKPDPSFYNNRGICKRKIGDLKGSVADYTEAIRLKPKYYFAFYNRALTKQDQEDFKGSLEDFTEAIRFNPRYYIAYFYRANLKRKLKMYAEALEDYNKTIQLNPEFDEAYNNRGLVKRSLGKLQEAIEDYNEGIRLDPKNFEAYNHRANAKKEYGDFAGAAEDYLEASRINPQWPTTYYNLGNLKEKQNQSEAAIEYYNKAIQLDPKYSEAYNNRAVSKMNKKDLSGALDDLNHAIRLDSQSPEYYLSRAEIKKVLKDMKGAIADCTIAIQLDPKSSIAYYNRGNAKKKLKQYSEALEDLSSAIRLNPQYVSAYYHRGVLKYEMTKNKEEAKSDFVEYLKLTQQTQDTKILKLRKNIQDLLPELKDK